MKLRLELVLLLALIIGLGVIAAYYADQRGQQAAGIRTTSFSSSDDGALALYRWLERIVPGRVDRLAYRPFALSAAEGMLFVLGPTERYEPAQVAAVTEWVRDGGVLVMADNRPSPRSTLSPLLKAFDLELKIITQTSTATPVHPALGSPPLTTLPVHTAVAIASTAPQPALAPLAVADTHPIVAGQRFGDGYVIVVSSLYPFTNDGLRQPESAAFMLNLLRWLPLNQKIVFDEFHHGFVPNADLRSLLLNIRLDGLSSTAWPSSACTSWPGVGGLCVRYPCGVKPLAGVVLNISTALPVCCAVPDKSPMQPNTTVTCYGAASVSLTGYRSRSMMRPLSINWQPFARLISNNSFVSSPTCAAPISTRPACSAWLLRGIN